MNNIRIVADSGCDLNDELKEKLNIDIVPLTLQIKDQTYIDDLKLDIQSFIKDMRESEESPKTASPSPNKFIESFKGEEDVFVVTLSSKLSSTYQNAVLAKEMFLEDVNNKFIHIFDSLSASIAETLVSMKITELAKENYDNLQIVEKVNEYIKEMKTLFILDSLENLMKSGRINKVKGKIASFLGIKSIMKATEEGSIGLVENVRGSKRALRRLVEIVGEKEEKIEDKIFGIAHCNALEKAEKIKKEVLKRYNFKDVIIVEARGVTSTYADEGSIIISF